MLKGRSIVNHVIASKARRNHSHGTANIVPICRSARNSHGSAISMVYTLRFGRHVEYVSPALRRGSRDRAFVTVRVPCNSANRDDVCRTVVAIPESLARDNVGSSCTFAHVATAVFMSRVWHSINFNDIHVFFSFSSRPTDPKFLTGWPKKQ